MNANTTFCTLSFPESSFIAPNSVIIPFDANGGLILVQANVNGIPGVFILDTGAEGLVLNSNYFSPESLIANSNAFGVGGAVSKVGEYGVDTMLLDELYFQKIKAQTIDLSQLESDKKDKISGLIGFDILKDFEIMIQYKMRYLTLSRVTETGQIMDPLPHTMEKVDSFAFQLGNFIPIIKVTIEGNSYKMGIDSGSEVNLLNIKGRRKWLKNFKILKKVKILGANGGSTEVLAGRMSRIVLGTKYKCASMATVLTNMDYLNKIYDTRLDGVLGYEFLAPWIFSINYKKKKLFLHKLKYYKP